ncbi:unnamed protein product [Cuscuta epithymum]|uniref:Uncharacterized protein n=1 Tax=Cuscuta epithymum TaxID=186058 RepID=A0AAV0FLE1_9ASTE|nr:unnamed protein product [Cuscuta epithymum]
MIGEISLNLLYNKGKFMEHCEGDSIGSIPDDVLPTRGKKFFILHNVVNEVNGTHDSKDPAFMLCINVLCPLYNHKFSYKIHKFLFFKLKFLHFQERLIFY